MKSCLWGVAGALLGLVGGLALAVVLGDAITLALKISNFEGGQAYFIAFVLFPIFGLIGLILGAIMIFQGWRFNLSVVALLLLSGVGFVYSYRAAFEEEFHAKRLKTDHSDESGSIRTTIDFQIGVQAITITYTRDEYSTPGLAMWQSSSTAQDDKLIEEISHRFDALLQTGVYDALFDEQFLRDPVAE
ncbi:MAG: hypothetical protein DYG89_03320 [Caldilinea sp. CFX5]|nr:hypothetical protein [Caldilinea sp. CFX5]